MAQNLGSTRVFWGYGLRSAGFMEGEMKNKFHFFDIYARNAIKKYVFKRRYPIPLTQKYGRVGFVYMDARQKQKK